MFEKRNLPKLNNSEKDLFFRYVKPGQKYKPLPHRDSTFWDRIDNTDLTSNKNKNYDERLKFWIPLINCQAENNLMICPKSHLEDIKENNDYAWEILKDKKLNKPCIDLNWYERNKKRFITPNLGENDLIVFHDKLVHQGMNHKNLTRISVEFTLLVQKD